MTNYHNTIFFTGGGTLGPVTPLFAVLQELKVGAQDFVLLRMVWVGTRNGPERKKIDLLLRDFRHLRYEWLPVAKLDRFFSVRILLAPFVFLAALLKSFFILLKYRPRVIVGAGAFTQVPLMWAGWVLRIPSLIHQQDVRVGLANKLCAWCANVITVNFDVSAKGFPSNKTRVVGNPVYIPHYKHTPSRSESGHPSQEGTLNNPLQRRGGSEADGVGDQYGFPALKPLLLVIGGGTGAEQLNRLVFLTAGELTKTFNIVLISGARDFGGGGVYLRPQGADTRSAPTEGLHIIHFVDDSYHLLEKADLVVTRAGMGTLTELASLGKPTIIVPIPHSHQVENARYYKDHGAAELMEIDYSETESKADEFVAKLREVWDNENQREELSGNIRKLYQGQSINLIIEKIQKCFS